MRNICCSLHINLSLSVPSHPCPPQCKEGNFSHHSNGTVWEVIRAPCKEDKRKNTNRLLSWHWVDFTDTVGHSTNFRHWCSCCSPASNYSAFLLELIEVVVEVRQDKGQLTANTSVSAKPSLRSDWTKYMTWKGSDLNKQRRYYHTLLLAQEKVLSAQGHS